MKIVTIAMTLATGIALGVAGTLYGPNLVQHAAQPYAGQQARAVSSLSADDVRQLLAGEGWGLAKPAELNGYPGPAHVLELADDLDLEAGQRAAIETSFAAMRASARALGERLVEAERALDAAFRSGAIDSAVLAERLEEAARLRGRLRRVHLDAHLQITPLLSDEQKTRYSQLRGYGSGGHGGHKGH